MPRVFAADGIRVLRLNHRLNCRLLDVPLLVLVPVPLLVPVLVYCLVAPTFRAFSPTLDVPLLSVSLLVPLPSIASCLKQVLTAFGAVSLTFLPHTGRSPCGLM